MIDLTKSQEQQTEPQQALPEQQRLKALVYPFKVIVNPLKAFREISQNARFVGVFFIIVLYILAAIGTECFRTSKIFLDSENGSISLLNSNLVAGNLVSFLLQSTSSFILNWIIFAGILFLLARLTGEVSSSWRSFIIVAGYAFMVIVIYYAVNALLISTLPEIHFQRSMWTSPESIDAIQTIFDEKWGSTFAAQALNYVSFAFQLWLVLLGSAAAHFSLGIKWVRAIMISFIAYFASALLTSILTLFIL